VSKRLSLLCVQTTSFGNFGGLVTLLLGALVTWFMFVFVLHRWYSLLLAV